MGAQVSQRAKKTAAKRDAEREREDGSAEPVTAAPAALGPQLATPAVKNVAPNSAASAAAAATPTSNLSSLTASKPSVRAAATNGSNHSNHNLSSPTRSSPRPPSTRQMSTAPTTLTESPHSPSVATAAPASSSSGGKGVLPGSKRPAASTAAQESPIFGAERPSSSRPTAAASTAPAETAPSEELHTADVQRLLAANASRLILVLFGDAYDITAFRDSHPGGKRVLLNYNGKECGDIFMRIHGLRAKKMVHQYYMGHVVEAGNAPSPLRRTVAAVDGGVRANPGTRAVNPNAQSTRILEKEPMNVDASIQYITFSAPVPIRLIPGGHIKIFSDVQRDEWRYYSPFRSEVASFTVCVKHYANGRTSGYLFQQPEGAEVFFEGPFAPSWQVTTDRYVEKATPETRHVLLLAGGTGVCPFFSITQHILTRQLASVTMVCSVHTQADLMLAEDINYLAARYGKPLPDQPHTLRVAVVYSRAPANESNRDEANPVNLAAEVQFGTRVNADFLKALNVPSTQAAVLCGPPAFNDTVADAVLQAGICPMACVHLFGG